MIHSSSQLEMNPLFYDLSHQPDVPPQKINYAQAIGYFAIMFSLVCLLALVLAIITKTNRTK